MGYSHAFHRQQTLNPENFIAWSHDVQTLLQHLPEHTTSAGGYYADDPLTIHGWDGTGTPEITDTLVSFNGDKALELDGETFYIPQFYEPEKWEYPQEDGTYYAWCKTERKPYDLLVTASLIRLKHHFPEMEISGGGSSKEWMEGLKLCTQVFGSAQLPFEE